MNLPDLLADWPVDGPWSCELLNSGNNNRSYAVTTPRERYILRIYQDTAEPDWVGYEHLLLTRLGRAELSFSVPAPLPACSGATLVRIPGGAGAKLAALFHRIPGQQPDGTALAQYRSCGAALGELDHALSTITIPASPSPRPPFGDFSQLHPAVPDPLEMLEQIPVDPIERAQLRRIVHDLSAALPMLYYSLPWQIVHRDFDASNVLMEGEHVTGVLDFEFAGLDLRVLDLGRSLSLFTISPWNLPDGWQRTKVFIMGYREHVELTPDEVEALPDVMRLFRVRSLVHREGHRRQGLASEEDVRARAMGLLGQEKWLSERRRDLMDALAPAR
jgi:homoserine kinase type II